MIIAKMTSKFKLWKYSLKIDHMRDLETAVQRRIVLVLSRPQLHALTLPGERARGLLVLQNERDPLSIPPWFKLEVNFNCKINNEQKVSRVVN